MNKESEDYLDQLLNSVQEQQPLQEQRPRKSKEHKTETLKETQQAVNRHNPKSQEEFIQEFEEELNGVDEEQLISDFELSLESDLFAGEEEEEEQEQEPLPQETTESEDSFFAGLDAAMNAENANAGDERSAEAQTETEELLAESPEDQPYSEGSTEKEHSATSEEEVGGLSMDDFPDLFGDVEGMMPEEESAGQTPEKGTISEEMPDMTASETSTESGTDPENTDDILSLLDGLGEENEDIADISNMLKADENHEAIESDGQITAESVADSLADLGFEVNPEDADELASLRELPPKQEAGSTVEKEESSKAKKGFLTRMKELFFGPDEETASEQKPSAEETSLDVSDENLDILKALEGGGSSAPAEDDPKAKKKAKKEEKKKAAAAKKEAKAKEKEAKKKEKAAAKAAKPKKEKKPKVKDNTPPLPKKPVFLIFLLAASILGGVLFAGKGMHRRLAMNDSENYFSQGEYVKAYNEVAGLKVKADNKKETQYMEKIEMLAGVQELYDSYESLLKAGRQELALDCLIRIIGHYDANIEKAGELGCSAQLTEYEGLAEELLKETYHTSFEEALRIYQIRSRVRYSTELVKILKEAGLD
ncbi:MAG: hypothetical protein ACI4CC_06070 [Lachnospiraceae bacterium]